METVFEFKTKSEFFRGAGK